MVCQIYGRRNKRVIILEIESRQFGKIDIDEDKIIMMAKGLPGFKGMNRFVLLDHEDLHPFFSFQSVDDPALSFILMDPFSICPDYDFDMEKTFEEMAWAKEELDKVFIYVIVNVSGKSQKDMTANLIGPLLLHSIKNEAVQVILSDSHYSSKQLVFPKLKR